VERFAQLRLSSHRLGIEGNAMKKLGAVLVAVIFAQLAHGQISLSAGSPAELRTGWAEAEIKANPDRSQPYNDLAVALVSRARETADVRYYDQAEAALGTSLQKSPGNLEGEKARIMIMLGRHQYAQARESASALNKKTPDDVLVYGLLADADIELGNYSEAEKSTQWMLDLRPGNVPGLLRAAKLRRIFGDNEGSLDLYSQAYQQIPPTQTEDIAWTLTQMADLQFSAGHAKEADDLAHSALEKFPGYYAALETSARIEVGRGHGSAAVDLLRRRNERFPSAASHYALANALQLAGERDKADHEYRDFETTALADGGANVELISYYLGPRNKPTEALRLAELEITRRHDVRTLDAYAWALCENARYSEAKRQIDLALGTGFLDSEIFYHAGVIAGRLHDTVASAAYLRRSLNQNPMSEVAGRAQEALGKLTSATLTAPDAYGSISGVTK